MRAITIDLDRPAGVVKPLHGVNNGPLGYGSLVDVSHYYREAEFPLVRLHDPNYPHPREIDIHTIFPDFGKDPGDPASYDFAKSDYYIATIVKTGARILWRLGESIEHTPTKYYVYPPADYAKWAQICIGIIRHYNQGWADGFRYGIQYWEIWNEPEGGGGMMWNGTDEQYYDLYRVAAPIIKAFDPSLKIGGYGAAQVKNAPNFFPDFLNMCETEKLPLDFFSWHSYNDDPGLVRELSLFVREGLDRRGFRHTESHYNEWSFFDADWTTLFLPGNEHYRRDLFERGKGAQGASYAAAVLALLQDCPVDAANYYDGQPSALFCGLFDYYGVPTKTYHAFRMFNELRHYARRVEVGNDNAGVYACAAAGETGGGTAEPELLPQPQGTADGPGTASGQKLKPAPDAALDRTLALAPETALAPTSASAPAQEASRLQASVHAPFTERLQGAAALISNYRGFSGFYDVSFRGAELAGEWIAEEYRIDGDRTGQLVARHPVSASSPLKLFMKKQSVVYLKLVNLQGG